MKYIHEIGAPRKKMRWEDFDYSSQSVYFITIVTNGRKCFLGHVSGGEMVRNDAGKMVLEQYYLLDGENIQCMDVVVMPNHIHFMVYLPKDGKVLLPVMMKKFKSVTTMLYCKGVAENGWESFDKHLWQRSYWDAIVWNGRQFEFIRRYIYLNPQRWDNDAINAEHGAEVDDINGCIKRLKMI